MGLLIKLKMIIKDNFVYTFIDGKIAEYMIKANYNHEIFYVDVKENNNSMVKITGENLENYLEKYKESEELFKDGKVGGQLFIREKLPELDIILNKEGYSIQNFYENEWTKNLRFIN